MRSRTVTVLEQDVLPVLPGPRRGLPQGEFSHILLGGGADAVEEVLPGTLDALLAAGAHYRSIPAGLLMRLGPGWLLTRVTATDTELGAHRLREGTTVVYSPYLLHRQSALFPDPDRFDPERWVGVHPQRGPFIGFGAGPRRCVGEQFGMTESVLLLATIMRAWRLEHVPGRTVRELPLATLRPGPVWMRATRRDGLASTGAAG